jgi:hypothetical protein
MKNPAMLSNNYFTSWLWPAIKKTCVLMCFCMGKHMCLTFYILKKLRVWNPGSDYKCVMDAETYFTDEDHECLWSNHISLTCQMNQCISRWAWQSTKTFISVLQDFVFWPDLSNVSTVHFTTETGNFSVTSNRIHTKDSEPQLRYIGNHCLLSWFVKKSLGLIL